jgi:hypothetical protein
MRFKNIWTGRTTQKVKVKLKKQVRRYKTENLIVEYVDLKEGEPKSVEIPVFRYGLTRNEKLGIVICAALDHFSEEVNRYLEEHYENAVCRGVPSNKEPVVEIDPKFMETVMMTAYLDKNHNVCYGKQLKEIKLPKLGSLAAAKTTMPSFINERAPNYHSDTDLRKWVKEKQNEARQ